MAGMWAIEYIIKALRDVTVTNQTMVKYTKELFRKDMSRKTLLIRLKDRFAEILRLHECFIIRRISRALELD